MKIRQLKSNIFFEILEIEKLFFKIDCTNISISFGMKLLSRRSLNRLKNLVKTKWNEKACCFIFSWSFFRPLWLNFHPKVSPYFFHKSNS